MFAALVETWELSPMLNPVQRIGNPSMLRIFNLNDTQPWVFKLSDFLYHLIAGPRPRRIVMGTIYSLHSLILPLVGLLFAHKKGFYLGRAIVINILFLIVFILLDPPPFGPPVLGVSLITLAIFGVNLTLLVTHVALLYSAFKSQATA